MAYIFLYLVLMLTGASSCVYGFDYAESLRKRTGIWSAQQFNQHVPLTQVYKEPSCTKRNQAFIEAAGLVLGYRPCICMDNIHHFMHVLNQNHDLLMALSYGTIRMSAVELDDKRDSFIVMYPPQYRYRALLLLLHHFENPFGETDADLYTKARLYLFGDTLRYSMPEIEHAVQYAEFKQQNGVSPDTNQSTRQAFDTFKLKDWPYRGLTLFCDANSLYMRACHTYDRVETIQNRLSQMSQTVIFDKPIQRVIDICLDKHNTRYAQEREAILNYIENITPAHEDDDKLI